MTQAGSAWQVPQAFELATSYQVRDELGDLVARDLLGPWGGDTEQFAPRAAGPRDRYLVGMLGPRRVSGANSVDDPLPDTEVAAEGGGEAELPELLTPQAAGRMWASSMGLSFAIGPDVDVIAARVAWGQYLQQEVQIDEGATRRVWTREPFEQTVEVRTDVAGSRRYWLIGQDGETFGAWLSAEVRDRGERRVVRLALINGQSEQVSPRDLAWLFQTKITVTAIDGTAPIFLPVRDLTPNESDPEERHLQLLYRDVACYATGHNVAVRAEADGSLAHRLKTAWLPSYDLAQTSAAPIEGLTTSMDALADLTDRPDDLVTALRPLVTGYQAWLDEEGRRVSSLPDALSPTAEAAIGRAEDIAARIEAGIGVLESNAQARKAFGFANQAMARQRRNTVAATLRGDHPELSYAGAYQRVLDRGAAETSWRPFQLAFVLLNLPALTDLAHSERSAVVDLLFFPTGGGKTEAYLGLAAYTFAIRRLQGNLGSGAEARDARDGVAVLMRYTLRLLTAQQFQRAAALVCAAETIRRGDTATWGSEPFRIGLWVGSAMSPNWYSDAAAQVAEAREAGAQGRSTVLQTLACPWCGTPLAAYRDLFTDEARRRVVLYCPEGEGPDACPFSRTRSPREGLPILTVDEEIYRLVPSLLIATVDKLAQLPWTGYAGMIFGRVSTRCPRHGYRHPDLDSRTGCGSKHHATASVPKAESVAVIRLRPPDLIIQDELHLISGALGTTVGLFESAVDELSTWPAPNGTRIGPKIVASTATTKRAAEQVRRLYAREIAIFPPPVLNASSTFFSAAVPVTAETPGRRYLGICAHGARLKSAEIRLAEILLIAGQTLFDRYGEPADPYLTLVGYFNATRELAGMRRYLDDDVAARLRRNGHRRGLADRLGRLNQMLTIAELTSRISSGDVATVLKRLEESFDVERDTTARRDAILAEFGAARQEKRQARVPERQRTPIDVALATSMLQVGVDVQRLGLMVVTGQPKNTAEYIQATSRVGRDANRPGLVITLYNWSRPRDLAHFEDFEHYHATFYRQIEALSVTPFSRRSLDRGTAGTYVAAVRNTVEQFSSNDAAFDVDLAGDLVAEIDRRLLQRAERAGGPSARVYFAERIAVLHDRWNQAKGGSARLGYQQAKQNGQQLAGLLESAGEGPWDVLTVGRSMRETENEINLLVPGSGLFDPVYGAPGWRFGSPPDTSDPDADTDDELGATGAEA